jgi:hypothetical protein
MIDLLVIVATFSTLVVGNVAALRLLRLLRIVRLAKLGRMSLAMRRPNRLLFQGAMSLA